MITKRFEIYGRVQGVGMRYFINKTASKYDVKGYVKNLYNGNVECVCQGDENEINAFLTRIKDNHPGHIERIDQDELKYTKTFNRFKITF
jgi:acylphosphatase